MELRPLGGQVTGRCHPPTIGQKPTFSRSESPMSEPQAETTPELPERVPADPVPQRVGRYRVERLLGAGGFGRVYLAHDDELDRPVAVKVPHRHRISQPEDVEAYLAEARVLAPFPAPWRLMIGCSLLGR